MDRRKINDYERGSEALAVLHSLLSYGDNLHYEKFSDGSVKCIEDEIPFELPDGWTWTRIKTVSIDLPYGTSKKSNSSGKVAVLRMGNLQDGEIDITLQESASHILLVQVTLKTGKSSLTDGLIRLPHTQQMAIY